MSEDMFMESWNILKKTKREKYKFLFGAGDIIRRVCLNICQTVWRTEVYPDSWNVATLVQLDKGKSPANSLDNKRHIHLKNEISKVFSHILVSASKDYFPVLFQL